VLLTLKLLAAGNSSPLRTTTCFPNNAQAPRLRSSLQIALMSFLPSFMWPLPCLYGKIWRIASSTQVIDIDYSDTQQLEKQTVFNKNACCGFIIRSFQTSRRSYSSRPLRSCKQTNKTNSVTFSPQANYTDCATATCWRNLVPTFAERGVSCGQRGGSPTVVNFSFLDRSRYLSFQVALHLPSQGLSGPRSRFTATQKIWQRRESNPGPLGLQPGSLTTRPQMRS
jgi:hypothetical protein